MDGKVSRLKWKVGERSPHKADARLPVLDRGRLHEIHAHEGDQATALAFAMCMGRDEGGGDDATILLRTAQRARWQAIPDGGGLVLLGIPPARLIVVETQNELDLLRAGHEAARCPGVGLALLETRGTFAKYDLTASRRLALAAEQSRNRVIMLRQDAEPRPSAAQTRWLVTSAPSAPLEADAPGWPAMEVKLLRQRGAPAGRLWRLEWDADHGTFRDATDCAPLPGAVASLFRVRESAEGDGPDYPRAA